jgi:hypothetical protein
VAVLSNTVTAAGLEALEPAALQAAVETVRVEEEPGRASDHKL